MKVLSILAVALSLSSIAWKNPGESLPDWENPPVVMKWILAEPDLHVRRSLVGSFFAQLEGRHFPECTKILWENDGFQTNIYSGEFLRVWAERDLISAGPMAIHFLNISSDSHFSDQWDDVVRGPDPAFRASLKSSPVWPSAGDATSFLSGIESQMGNPENRDMSAKFRKRYEERFGEAREPFSGSPSGIEDEPPYFSDVVTILTCPIEEVYPMLKLRALQSNSAAVAFGWRRVAVADPAAALEMDGCLAHEVFRVWARTDAAGLFDAIKTLQEEREVMAAEQVLAFGDEGVREKMIKVIASKTDEEGENDWRDALEGLARRDPQGFLNVLPRLKMNPLAERYCRDEILTWAFEETSSEKVRAALRKIFFSHDPLLADDPAYILMETWGEIDVGEAARFAVTWHLASAKYANTLSKEDRENWQYWDKKHLVGVWSGKHGTWDSSMDDRAFGTLRKWAVCEPNVMAAWIDTLEDKEIREALHWLRDHAEGGLPAQEG